MWRPLGNCPVCPPPKSSPDSDLFTSIACAIECKCIMFARKLLSVLRNPAKLAATHTDNTSVYLLSVSNSPVVHYCVYSIPSTGPLSNTTRGSQYQKNIHSHPAFVVVNYFHFLQCVASSLHALGVACNSDFLHSLLCLFWAYLLVLPLHFIIHTLL